MQGVWALTGGIASGKTTVASLLEARGAVVIDADQIAREVVEPGSDGLQAIRAHFGDHVLHADGTLNREALGTLIFNDGEARAALNGILHPRIFMRSLERMSEALRGARRPVFYDAALIVENGAWESFDGLVVVAAHADLQHQRLMARNDLNADEASQRIDAQYPLAKKIEVADYVIDNDHDLDHLSREVDRVLHAIRERAAHASPEDRP